MNIFLGIIGLIVGVFLLGAYILRGIFLGIVYIFYYLERGLTKLLERKVWECNHPNPKVRP